MAAGVEDCHQTVDWQAQYRLIKLHQTVDHIALGNYSISRPILIGYCAAPIRFRVSTSTSDAMV